MLNAGSHCILNPVLNKMSKTIQAHRLQKKISSFFFDFFTSGLTDIHNVELIRKVNMLNAIGIISISALIPLGLDAMRLGNFIVGVSDIIVATILASGIIYLRKGKNFNFIINLSLSAAALLFFSDSYS